MSEWHDGPIDVNNIERQTVVMGLAGIAKRRRAK
jgi:hypothetical protein